MLRNWCPASTGIRKNVGASTNLVFGLHSEVTDFHQVLDALVRVHGDLEEIEEQFPPHGLSLQARAYVMNRLSKKGST
jgi:hypothetical protein